MDSAQNSGPSDVNMRDLEDECGIKIKTYSFESERQICIGNSVTIHYAGYFLQSNDNWEKIEADFENNKYESGKKKYFRTTDQDVRATWHSRSVISLLEDEFNLPLFCSTWPEHGDKILPGPLTFTLGGEDHPLVPSLSVAIKEMKVGEVRVIKVPEVEVYGLDLSHEIRRERAQPEKPAENKSVVEKTNSLDEYQENPVDPEDEEQETNSNKKKEKHYSSSSEDSDYDPDEVLCEPWCEAPGAKGEYSTFFHKVEGQDNEVHRGLRGFVYVVQLLGVCESQPPRDIIHIKKPLETTDKKSDKPEGGKQAT